MRGPAQDTGLASLSSPPRPSPGGYAATLSRKRERVCASPDLFFSAHIRLQRFGNGDAAVGVLIVFQHRDERTPDRETRAVQRVHEALHLAVLAAIARVHAARLEI